MRTLVIAGWVVGSLLLTGCEDKPSGGATGTPGEADAAKTTAPTTSASGSSSANAKTEPPKTGPKVEGPKDFVTRMKALDDAFAAHDPKKISELYADDAVVKTPGMPDTMGKDAIEKDAEHMFAVFKDAKLTHGRIWEKDKRLAVVESVFTGTNTGEAPQMGITKATNKTVGVVGAAWIQVNEDGLIKEEHRYHDAPTAMGQLVPDKKNPVRAVVTAPPDGTLLIKAKEERDVREAKDPALKADIEKAVELQRKNAELENKFAVAFSTNKLDDALKLVADDVVFVDYSTPTDVKGRKAYKDLLSGYLTAFPDLKAKITSIFGDGDFVVLEYDYTGTQKGALGPIKPTNKSVELHQVEVDLVKDGKFVKGWAWGNNAELLGQLGLLPTPGAAPAPSASGAPSAAPSAKPSSTVR